jgi:hypothetical protein
MTGQGIEAFSLSVFTIEADRKPILAVAAKTHQAAEDFCTDERVRTKIRSIESGQLCDNHSILRVRLATADERSRYYQQATSPLFIGNLEAVFLVDVDEE